LQELISLGENNL